MNQNIFGLIFAGEENYNLRDLTMSRSLAALPVGCRYRVIDFLLSNMVNTGIRNVGIITQRNYQSLMDHLGSGKEWDLSRKKDGLFILPPFDTVDTLPGHEYYGLCDAVRSKLAYLHKASQQFCVLCGSYTLYNSTYDAMLKAHLANNADVTLLYNVEPPDAVHYHTRFKDARLSLDPDGRVTDIEYNSAHPNSNLISMGVYLMDKSLLEYLVENACAHGRYSMIMGALHPHLQELRVYAVEHTSYVARLHNVKAYYDLNLDMLREPVRRDLFYSENTIYTKIKDEPSAKYFSEAEVQNSILGDGCEINGTIIGSVISRGVTVGRGARIINSVIMQDAKIEENCVLENVILDKKVMVRKGQRLVSSPDFPIIIRKGALI